VTKISLHRRAPRSLLAQENEGGASRASMAKASGHGNGDGEAAAYRRASGGEAAK